MSSAVKSYVICVLSARIHAGVRRLDRLNAGHRTEAEVVAAIRDLRRLLGQRRDVARTPLRVGAQ